MRKINMIVIHCADTPSTMDIGVKEIRDWHVNDNGWSDVGYHYVIRRDGTIEKGRKLEVVGSHVYGYNKNSIGICLVGGKPIGKQKKNIDLFTIDQLESLESLLFNLKGFLQDSNIKIVGHCELDNKKTCPNFDVQEWLKTRGIVEE